MKAAAPTSSSRRPRRLRDRIKQLKSRELGWPGAGASLAVTLETWTKDAVLEVQEYVRLLGQVGRAVVTPPFYYRDIIEQFDRSASAR